MADKKKQKSLKDLYKELGLSDSQVSSKGNVKKDVWKEDLLKPLSVKKYGRSYKDKQKNIFGGDEWASKDFERFMDYRSARNSINSHTANKATSNWEDAREKRVKSEKKKAKEQNKMVDKVSKERDGFLGFLDSTLGRIGDAAQKFAFEDDFVKKQNEVYAKNAVDQLKKNPKDKQSIQALQMMNTTARAPKNNLEKASDFIGTSAGALAPYAIGGAYGAADMALGKVGLNAIKSPIAKDLVRGIGAGAIAGTERELAQKAMSNDKINPVNIAMEAGFAGTGDAAVGAFLRNINLKGQTKQLFDDMGAARYSDETLQKAYQEAFGPKGNASNVLADARPNFPKPVEKSYNISVPKKTMDDFVPNELPKVDAPPVMDDWFNFTGQTPKARTGFNQAENVPRYGRELISQRADEILNQVNKLDNAPEGGFNQRLLNIQQEMKAFSNNRGIYRKSLSPDELYQAVKTTNDPATFDDLIKLAELEANAKPYQPSLKEMLQRDPKIREAVQQLNELGGAKRTSPITPKPLEAPAPNFEEDLRLLNGLNPGSRFPEGYKLNVPELPQRPSPNLLPSLKPKGSAPAKSNGQFLMSLGDGVGKPKGGANVEPKVNPAEAPVKLRSIKPVKDVNIMTKDELDTVRSELSKQLDSLKKQGKKASKQKVAEIQKDIEEVDGLLMKLNLQQFGKNEPKIIETPKQERTPQQEYAISQSRQEQLVKEYEKKGKQTETEVAKMLEHSDDWKDKGRFFLGRETMERNFEDVMGADAPKFKQKFLEPIKSKEAERVRFLNEERSRVKSYGIKAKSLDDQLVQMYGEKKITLEELKQKTPNWEKVVEVSDAYRKRYDELLDIVNKELTANGFKEIPKRQDYFPHYEEIDSLMKKLGFDMENHALPTDINGLTDQFKPNKSFFSHALRRKGEETTFGAIQGFDRYIEGISNVIYHTKNIKQLRALDKVLRHKYEGTTDLSNFAAQVTEYTNLLAGKKGKIDRAVEDTFGRGVYNAVETLRRKTGANMIGANIASNLTNFIPLTQSLATTNKKAFVKGLFETLSNVVKSDGFVQQSDFLTKRVGSDPLYRTMWDSTIDKSMWLMRTLDNFSSQVITRGKYNELIEKGIPHEQAIKQADTWANKLMAGRAKGDMPTLFNSKTFGVVAQFQLEVNNQISFLFKDIPKNAPNKAALASAVGQVLLYSYLFNNLYEKAIGRRPAFDPVGIAFQAQKDYTNDNLSKGDATLNTTKNVLGQLPFTSVFTGGRIPISAGIPNPFDAMGGRSSWSDELTKPLWYLGLPAGGSQIKKTYEGLTTMDLNPLSPQGATGSYQNGKLKYPVQDNIANNIRAPLFGQYSVPEAREYYSNKRTPLSEQQTKAYELMEKKGHGQDLYEFLRIKDTSRSDKAKVTRIIKDEDLSNSEKLERIKQLLK